MHLECRLGQQIDIPCAVSNCHCSSHRQHEEKVSSSSVCELHFHYCVYVPAPYDIYWILLLCSDVLCASDKSITCMGFHSTTGVLFTGGLDGTIRFWRLNVDNEAYCLSRPPDHETKTAVGYALNGPTKHSPPKVVHTSEEARLRPPGGFPLMPDEVSVSSSATFASDTISIQNYKLEKNLGQVVESFCAMQCSEDFLLTGDDSGEMLLWVCYCHFCAPVGPVIFEERVCLQLFYGVL